MNGPTTSLVATLNGTSNKQRAETNAKNTGNREEKCASKNRRTQLEKPDGFPDSDMERPQDVFATKRRTKLREFYFYCIRKKLHIVVLSEVTADESGVHWIEEGEVCAVDIHSKKAAIMLSRSWKHKWILEDQKNGRETETQRSVTVVSG